jgi:hypothetical protein
VVAYQGEEPGCEGLAVEVVSGQRLEEPEEDVLAGVLSVVVVLEGLEEVAVDVGKMLVIEAVASVVVSRLGHSDEIVADRCGGFDVGEPADDGRAARRRLPEASGSRTESGWFFSIFSHSALPFGVMRRLVKSTN